VLSSPVSDGLASCASMRRLTQICRDSRGKSLLFVRTGRIAARPDPSTRRGKDVCSMTASRRGIAQVDKVGRLPAALLRFPSSGREKVMPSTLQQVCRQSTR
jgi:hypothetical protein